MLAVGALIWVSLRPLLRLVLCAGFGFVITKADIFPIVAARGAGQVALNITGPCLMFSKIVPSFSTSNIGTLGPLFLVGIIYEVLGLALAWFVRQFFWVPHRFRYGLLAAGGWSNYGDIPTSVVMSITAGPPFNSSSDQSLAVAYISAFILVFYITLFPLGGSRLIAWDWVGPDVEDDEVREATRLRRQAVLRSWGWAKQFIAHPRRRKVSSADPALTRDVHENDAPADLEKCSSDATALHRCSTRNAAEETEGSIAGFDMSIADDMPQMKWQTPTEVLMSPSTSAAPTVVHGDALEHGEHHDINKESSAKTVRFTEQPPQAPSVRSHPRVKAAVKNFLLQLCSPPSISIIVSFVISLIDPVKALFIHVPGTYMPDAPDGQPPLAFIMDTATFVGAASVPLGLICLGSALARLKVPMTLSGWKAMPVGAISAFAVAKIVISPVLGVLICQGLTMANIIDKNDKVLRFVCLFFSCLPTATTQVYITQVYSPTGDAEHVSAFLVPQYVLLIFFMTILTAYSLNLIF
ncbi:auxin efflux carrier [Trametopsis cervina]|nr:auxin efflux carrier [Trametopsis cervina]